MLRHKPVMITGLLALILFLAGGMIFTSHVSASALLQDATPTPVPTSNLGDLPPEQLSIGDDVCLSCHGQPGLTMELEDSSTYDLSVFPEDHASSIHGTLGYACVQCHSRVGNYPHPTWNAPNAREATIQLNVVCQRCHAYQVEKANDSVHARSLQSGNRQAAVCSDCHGSHTVQRLNDPKTNHLTPEARLWIPTTCARCHSEIYNKYRESVHGSALIGQGNPDVPTCIDCHGVHNIEDPTTATFRLQSPQICAGCHTNPKIMNKYGISTQVLNTYVADFHGTTVTLFEQKTPDSQVNVPVCYDCHGVHDIVAVNDPQKGLSVQQNLLARCQECHPDAAANFPTAWLSHYIPSPEKNPLVYYVDLFYKIFIPAVLIPMALLAVMDFGRATYNRYRSRQKVTSTPPALEQEQPHPAPAQDALAELDTLPVPQPALEDETSLVAETPSKEEQKPEEIETVQPETDPAVAPDASSDYKEIELEPPLEVESSESNVIDETALPGESNPPDADQADPTVDGK